jgi:hypothetical protein
VSATANNNGPAKVRSLIDLKPVRLYLARIGAEARSLRTAVIRETHGKYWKDIAVIHFGRDGEVSCDHAEYLPTETEQADILKEWNSVIWPQLKPLHRIVNPPDQIKGAESKYIFEFRNLAGLITMVQVRVDIPGDKKYIPWTYWDDDEWRQCEPDGPLPLYNEHRLANAACVFIHEGAKAARHVQWMVDGETVEARDALVNHPWGQQFRGSVHIGWIGGAMSPYRTDWGVIKRQGINRAYIIADNDEPGVAAVPSISQKLRMPTFMVKFTDQFPDNFDLADKFPSKMFGHTDGVKHFIGPSFRDCLHPATWATDMVPNPATGKPHARLRDSFRDMWAYVEEADLFVCTEMPEIMRPEKILNNMMAPFSHVAETCRLIVKAYRGRTARIAYCPDQEGLNVTFRGSSAINMHVPSQITPSGGDPTPFLDFMKYMFVNERERHEVLRWCATLIAKPEVRMGYALLLISERQGIGKTTLGAHILAPLIGMHNVGFPGENDITSAFNEWMANKRLVIINEIYTGSSWKSYHSLKSVITDRDVTVNQKYMRQYVIENWCHILACSNSARAMKIENDDRRWFYPEIAEVPWEKQKFTELRQWIEGGGLRIIKHWAQTFGDYVAPSDNAPMTERKKEMIEGSRSDAQKEAVALAECLKDLGRPGAVLMSEVIGWVRQTSQGRVFDTDYELRKAMKDVGGVYCWPKRLKLHGRLQYVMVNDPLYRDVSGSGQNDLEQLAALREKLIKPSELMESTM